MNRYSIALCARNSQDIAHLADILRMVISEVKGEGLQPLMDPAVALIAQRIAFITSADMLHIGDGLQQMTKLVAEHATPTTKKVVKS
jgi:hypothetical protein